MKNRGFKMFGITLACVLFVPLLAVLFLRFPYFDDPLRLRFAVASVFFALVLAGSILYLRSKRPERRELSYAFIAFLVTLPYTIPFMPISALAAVATAAATKVLFQMRKSGASIPLYQRSLSTNLLLLGIITVFYVLLYGSQHGFRFTFVPKAALQCLAPGFSEEVIFRGVLTAALFMLFRLDKDSLSANLWVFFTLTVPFALLHYPELSVSGVWLFSKSWTIFFQTAIDYFLARKYGLAYAIYSHALNDYFAFIIV